MTAPRTLTVRRHPWLAAILVTGLGCVIWATLVEPRLVPRREDRALPWLLGPPAPPVRIAHLADLHVDTPTARLDRLVEDVATARPDAILVSGDWIADDRHDLPTVARRSATAAALVRALRQAAPVVTIEGHADHHGILVRELAAAGGHWLRNETAWLRLASGALAVRGLSQQAGGDERVPRWPARFETLIGDDGVVEVRYRHVGKRRNVYASYDPPATALPGGAAAPLDWSAVDLRAELLVEDPAAAVGVALHSREPLGEHRGIRLARARVHEAESGSFALTYDGSWPTAGVLDTGVAPEAGRWYTVRMHSRVAPGRVIVEAKVWPTDEPEPDAWQAWAEDASPTRIETGTVALWGWYGGEVRWRRLRVEASDGSLLLRGFEPGPTTATSDADAPAGFRVGSRGSRLALARTRVPPPPAAPLAGELVLCHSPDSALEAASAGADWILAGHTHGGQVRVPGLGALTTRTFLGGAYDRGAFAFAAPNQLGVSWLLVNPGVGTSLAPVRFASPPAWTLVTLVPGAETTAQAEAALAVTGR